MGVINPEKLGGKFSGIVYRDRDGAIEPDWIVFVPRDNLIMPLLEHYLYLCQQAGCDSRQTQAVEHLLARVERWRERNHDKCKLPDVERNEL